jgi:hypothetical protein
MAKDAAASAAAAAVADVDVTGSNRTRRRNSSWNPVQGMASPLRKLRKQRRTRWPVRAKPRKKTRIPVRKNKPPRLARASSPAQCRLRATVAKNEGAAGAGAAVVAAGVKASLDINPAKGGQRIPMEAPLAATPTYPSPLPQDEQPVVPNADSSPLWSLSDHTPPEPMRFREPFVEPEAPPVEAINPVAESRPIPVSFESAPIDTPESGRFRQRTASRGPQRLVAEAFQGVRGNLPYRTACREVTAKSWSAPLTGLDPNPTVAAVGVVLWSRRR